MASRRMFAKSIVLSDAFLDMPMSARCLYFTLSMLADDEGFVGSPKAIMRQCGASQDDLLLLLQKRYILGFDSGVIVIKHWKINNYLQKDRIIPTTYLEELSQLALDEKKAYTEKEKQECIQNVYEMDTDCKQTVYTDKNSIGKNSIDKISVGDGGSSRYIQEPTDDILDEIIREWNDIPHTINIKAIAPLTKRWNDVHLCLSYFGNDGVMDAIRKVAASEYLKKKGNIAFDSYFNPDAMQKLLEGNYDKDYSRQTDSVWERLKEA
jgi:hypothetical protein